MRWALLTALFLAGCDPAVGAAGMVRTAPTGLCGGTTVAGDVYGGSRPLEGATVSLVCPENDRPNLSAMTDAEGKFDRNVVGLVDDHCKVLVAKPGYYLYEVPVAGHCAQQSSLGCHFVSVYAELIPLPASPTPAPPAEKTSR